jgi:hypothetical protein
VRRQDTTFDGTRTDDIDIRSTGTGVLIGLGGGAILDTVIYSAISKDALGVAAAIGDPSALSALVRGVVRSMDASVPVYDLEPLTNTLDRATARTRFVLTILAAVAAITLLLGAIGGRHHADRRSRRRERVARVACVADRSARRPPG